MNCLYCGKRIWRILGAPRNFCSPLHELQFQQKRRIRQFVEYRERQRDLVPVLVAGFMPLSIDIRSEDCSSPTFQKRREPTTVLSPYHLLPLAMRGVPFRSELPPGYALCQLSRAADATPWSAARNFVASGPLDPARPRRARLAVGLRRNCSLDAADSLPIELAPILASRNSIPTGAPRAVFTTARHHDDIRKTSIIGPRLLSDSVLRRVEPRTSIRNSNTSFSGKWAGGRVQVVPSGRFSLQRDLGLQENWQHSLLPMKPVKTGESHEKRPHLKAARLVLNPPEENRLPPPCAKLSMAPKELLAPYLGVLSAPPEASPAVGENPRCEFQILPRFAPQSTCSIEVKTITTQPRVAAKGLLPYPIVSSGDVRMTAHDWAESKRDHSGVAWPKNLVPALWEGGGSFSPMTASPHPPSGHDTAAPVLFKPLRVSFPAPVIPSTSPPTGTTFVYWEPAASLSLNSVVSSVLRSASFSSAALPSFFMEAATQSGPPRAGAVLARIGTPPSPDNFLLRRSLALGAVTVNPWSAPTRLGKNADPAVRPLDTSLEPSIPVIAIFRQTFSAGPGWPAEVHPAGLRERIRETPLSMRAIPFSPAFKRVNGLTAAWPRLIDLPKVQARDGLATLTLHPVFPTSLLLQLIERLVNIVPLLGLQTNFREPTFSFVEAALSRRQDIMPLGLRWAKKRYVWDRGFRWKYPQSNSPLSRHACPRSLTLDTLESGAG